MNSRLIKDCLGLEPGKAYANYINKVNGGWYFNGVRKSLPNTLEGTQMGMHTVLYGVHAEMENLDVIEVNMQWEDAAKAGLIIGLQWDAAEEETNGLILIARNDEVLEDVALCALNAELEDPFSIIKNLGSFDRFFPTLTKAGA